MKQIVFLRPAPYSDIIAGNDLVTSFELAGLGLADPQIQEFPKEVLEKIEKIKRKYLPTIVYTSPAARTLETAKAFDLPLVVDSNLKEILFSLKESVPQEVLGNPNTLNVNTLRVELMKSFAAGKTKEKPAEVITRMNALCQKVVTSSDESILCISHAFVMKCYELFYKSNCDIQDHSIFSTGYDWNKKPYEFLDGFVASLDLEGKIRVDAL